MNKVTYKFALIGGPCDGEIARLELPEGYDGDVQIIATLNNERHSYFGYSAGEVRYVGRLPNLSGHTADSDDDWEK